MLTLEQALAILFDTIRLNKRHPDYQHVCDLATLYEQLITGKDIDKLLKQFVRRENKDEFDQRVLLTQQICPAWAESIMTPFYLVGRLDNVKRAINFGEGVSDADKKRAEIEDALGSFYGNESLEEYLATRFVELNFSDPNTFIVIEFDDFDNVVEKASPYPIEYSSSEAINFLYKKNKLQWLIIKEPPVPVILADKTKRNAEAYRIYTPNFAVRLQQSFDVASQFNTTGIASNGATQVVNDLSYSDVKATPINTSYQNAFADPNAVVNGFWFQNPSKAFEVNVAYPEGGEIQAIRVGYKSDLITKGRTFVNPFNAAIPYFKKSIKLVSESDLSDSLHAFPQKEMFIDICEGNVVRELSCNKGVDQNGKVCKVCGGLGYKVPKSSQDAVYIPWPKANVLNPIKPGEVVKYAQLPVELLKYQNDKIDALELKAKRSVYNAESLIKATVDDTATGVNVKQNEKNNTLFPFAKNCAKVWKFGVRLTANFTDNGEGLQEVCEYPKDLKLMTQDELLVALKEAADSGAPAFFIQSIQHDLAQKINAGDPNGYLKIITKERFMPFLGKTPEEIMFILASGYARLEDQILWTHNDTIFDDLEQAEPGFFSFTYNKQWPLIQEKIKAIAADLPKNVPAEAFATTISAKDNHPQLQ